MISFRAGASLAASARVVVRPSVSKHSFLPEFSRMKAYCLACSLPFTGAEDRPACQISHITPSGLKQFVMEKATGWRRAGPKRELKHVLITETLRQKSR